MRFSTGGYSSAQYDNYQLRAVVKNLVKAIPYYLKAMNATGIVVQGKSGLSMAFATLSHIDFPLIVVRKAGENSHGNKIEASSLIDHNRLLILDDFVASGDTFRRIEKDLNDYAEGTRWQHPSPDHPEIVGALLWSSGLGGENVRLKDKRIYCVCTDAFDERFPKTMREPVPHVVEDPTSPMWGYQVPPLTVGAALGL